MTNHSNFNMTGIWVPLVTPFQGVRQQLDLEAAQILTRHLITQGVDGLIVGATTGESAALTVSEHLLLIATMLEAADDQCPIMVGISGSNTAHVVSDIERYNEVTGIAGFLMSAPSYVRPSQLGIQRHFEAAAAATDLPFAIYNIPYRTGVNIELETLQALSQNPQFIAVKESGNGNVAQLSQQIDQTSLNIMSGEDSMIFVCSCLGGQGAISAAAHIRPDLYKLMHQHIQHGRLSEARKINQVLQPMIDLLFSEPNPAPIKAALSIMGLIESSVRLPMTSASADCVERLNELLPTILDLKFG
jgi:4-hydroxy-tetrahydrodipicolinate synthase